MRRSHYSHQQNDTAAYLQPIESETLHGGSDRLLQGCCLGGGGTEVLTTNLAGTDLSWRLCQNGHGVCEERYRMRASAARIRPLPFCTIR
jgi:hypothetical protein